MRGVQEKYGADKVAVVLLDVDRDYGATESQATADAKSAMKEHGAGDWPCVILPNGWKDMNENFGIDGYQVVVIDPAGNVVIDNTYGDELDPHVRKGLGL